MKWHQTPADVSKVSMNMPFLLLEVLLWYPQSQEKCPLVFWLCISSFQGWIHSCWRRLWTHVLGTPTPSHSELPPCPGWGDTNTHQQVQQWQLPPNFSTGWQQHFFQEQLSVSTFPPPQNQMSLCPVMEPGRHFRGDWVCSIQIESTSNNYNK